MLICSIGLFVNAGYVSSATITVTTTEPGISADGLCSFAEAVENVRDGDVYSDCEAGSDGLNIIELGQHETYLQREGAIYLIGNPGELTLINGNGSTFDAMDEENGWGSIWLGDAIINDLTIRGSRDSNGAILALESLSLNRCTVTENRIGVNVGGTFIAMDSHFVSNVTAIDGGGVVILIDSSIIAEGGTGIELQSGADLSVFHCTLKDTSAIHGWRDVRVDIRNSLLVRSAIQIDSYGGPPSYLSIVGSSIVDGQGGGIFLHGSVDAIVSRSTISGNSPVNISLVHPSVVPGESSLSVRDSTIVGPPGSTQISIWARDGEPTTRYATVTIKNTIVAGSYWYQSSNCEVSAADSTTLDVDFVSEGFNISDDDSCGLDHSTDMVVSDVMLSELGDWGGSTPTHMPLEGSPAIDMGGTDCPRKDQRGYKRPTDGNDDGIAICDCGAVEYNSYPLPTQYEHETVSAVAE
jgi:hypothetical protein